MMIICFSKKPILLLICMLFSGCRQIGMNETNGITVIDVEQHLGKYQEILASEFIFELEYVPLETNENCVIGGIRHLIVTPTHIFLAGSISLGSSYCYAFDRKGQFICNIGSVGQGPGEYTTITGLSIDEDKQSLYITTFPNVLEYSWDGVFRKSIYKPQNMSGDFIGEVYALTDNLFIGHVPNYTGNEMFNYILFNDSSQVIKSFENHIKFNRRIIFYDGLDRSIMPFKILKHIYVKELTNDTLYCLNEQNVLIPQFVFNVGKKHAYPKQLKEEFLGHNSSSLLKDVITIPTSSRPMVGTSNYIFFSISCTRSASFPLPKGIVRTTSVPFGGTADMELSTPLGVYDISNQTTQLLDTDPYSRMLGLINDLDGGLSFWPRYYTEENELVGFWQAYEMKEILTEEYFAAHEIKNPQAHQRLKELLKNLDEEDNPVIVIAKLK